MAVNNRTVAEKQALNLYREFELVSGVFLLVLSTVGVSSNSLLLISIWKKSNKLFRSPTTNFIIGLAIADLLTGLTTEPFFALYYFVCYYNSPGSDITSFKTVFKVGAIISTITVSSSFIIVLALSCSQYVAIEYPHKYKKFVTKKRTLIIVLSSWIYFFCFGFLRFGDINEEIYFKVHLAIHSSLVSLILFVILVLLYRSFQRKLSQSNEASYSLTNVSQKLASNDQLNSSRLSLKRTNQNPSLYFKSNENGSVRNSIASEEALDKVSSAVSNISVTKNRLIRTNMVRKSQRKILIERQLTYVSFYLASILLISALPHVILAQTFLYRQDSFNWRKKIDFRIALLVSDIFLLLKVGLDPFVYAWRLTSYRQALRETLGWCCRPEMSTPRTNGPSSNKI